MGTASVRIGILVLIVTISLLGVVAAVENFYPELLFVFDQEMSDAERESLRANWKAQIKSGAIPPDVTFERFVDAVNGGEPLPGWK